MASRYLWTNSDGLKVFSGRRTSDNQVARKVTCTGVEQEIEVLVPQGMQENADEQGGYPALIPAGATITDVQLHSNGALTSLVDLIVGIADADGGTNETDADGLVLAIDAAEVVALRPTGSVVGTAFDGPQLTASTPLAEDVYVTWSVTTPSSAGDIRILVKYIMGPTV